MKLNKGFAWLPALLIVLAGIVVGVGLYKYEQWQTPGPEGQTQSQAKNSTNTIASEQPTKPIPTVQWRPASEIPSAYVNGPSEWTWYSVANGAVYCMNQIISGADMQTFEANPYGVYGKDKNHAYYCSDIISGADTSTFVPIGREYAKDATHVYYSDVPIGGADPLTFAFITHPSNPIYPPDYAKDKNRIYDIGVEALEADPTTFTQVASGQGGDWYGDKNNEYINGKPVRGITNTMLSKNLVASLPPGCQTKESSNDSLPYFIPNFFSADGSVVGYDDDNGICVVDTNAQTAQQYTLQGITPAVMALSQDGSKIYYQTYYCEECEGVDPALINAANVGLRVIDRKTGTDTLVVHDITPATPTSTVAFFWRDVTHDVDVDLSAGFLIEMDKGSGQKTSTISVRKLPQSPWDFMTDAEEQELPTIRTLTLPQGDVLVDARVSQDGMYVDYIYGQYGTKLPLAHSRLNIATGEISNVY